MIFFGLLIACVVLGGIASLACIIDTQSAHRSPLPFAVFFFGVGTFLIGGALAWVGSFSGAGVSDALGMLGGPVIGGVGGGVLGYRLGLNRKRRYANDNHLHGDAGT
jgi:hypothetical protein